MPSSPTCVAFFEIWFPKMMWKDLRAKVVEDNLAEYDLQGEDQVEQALVDEADNGEHFNSKIYEYVPN